MQNIVWIKTKYVQCQGQSFFIGSDKESHLECQGKEYKCGNIVFPPHSDDKIYGYQTHIM